MGQSWNSHLANTFPQVSAAPSGNQQQAALSKTVRWRQATLVMAPSVMSSNFTYRTADGSFVQESAGTAYSVAARLETHAMRPVSAGQSQTVTASKGDLVAIRIIARGDDGGVSITYSRRTLSTGVTSRYRADGTLQSFEYNGYIQLYPANGRVTTEVPRPDADSGWIRQALDRLEIFEADFRKIQRELSATTMTDHVLLPGASSMQIREMAYSLKGLSGGQIADFARIMGKLDARGIIGLAGVIGTGAFRQGLDSSLGISMELAERFSAALGSFTQEARTALAACMTDLAPQLGALKRDPMSELLRDMVTVQV